MDKEFGDEAGFEKKGMDVLEYTTPCNVVLLIALHSSVTLDLYHVLSKDL